MVFFVTQCNPERDQFSRMFFGKVGFYGAVWGRMGPYGTIS